MVAVVKVESAQGLGRRAPTLPPSPPLKCWGVVTRLRCAPKSPADAKRGARPLRCGALKETAWRALKGFGQVLSRGEGGSVRLSPPPLREGMGGPRPLHAPKVLVRHTTFHVFASAPKSPAPAGRAPLKVSRP